MSGSTAAAGEPGYAIGMPVGDVPMLTCVRLVNENFDVNRKTHQYTAVSGCFGRWPLGFRLIAPAARYVGAVAVQGKTSVPSTLTPTILKIDIGYKGFIWKWEGRDSEGDVMLSAFGDDPFQPPAGDVWRSTNQAVTSGKIWKPIQGFTFKLTLTGRAHVDAARFDGQMQLRLDPACVRVDGLPSVVSRRSRELFDEWLHVDGCPDEFQLHLATSKNGNFVLGHGYVTSWCGRRLHGRRIRYITATYTVTTSSVYLDGLPPWTARIHRQFPHLARAVVATVHLCNHRGALPAEGGARLPRLPSELLWEILERFTALDMMSHSVPVPAVRTNEFGRFSNDFQCLA